MTTNARQAGPDPDARESAAERRGVVVADGNTGRGSRVVDECSTAGFPCKLAPHGAAALEIALATQPAVVIAQLDLPLVDAVKLAEILRANPRTRHTRFVFLGAGDSLGARGAVGDRLLASDARPGEIVQTVAELLDRQGRIDALDTLARPGGTAEGEIGELPLADLLQSLMMQRRSGRLSLVREAEGGGPEQGVLLLRDGEVIQAGVGQVDGEKALFRLLTWSTGHFSFESGLPAEAPVILAPTRRLLVEGLRQLEEWDRHSTRLPPLEAPVRLNVKNSELPNIVHPLTQEVLLLLELYGQVREVVDHCAYPDYQVLRTLHTLDERGIVQIGRVPAPGPAVVAPTERLFSDGQARRLAEWLRVTASPGQSGEAIAKLLVVAAAPGSIPEFLGLLESVPEVDLEIDPARGAELGDSLATLARIGVADDVSIELVHVPSGTSWEPFWPVAGHGALGTLFLLGAPVSGSTRRIETVADRLGRLPRARTFHVVLLGPDQRVGPDELRENLALIDEASLFLLPTRSDKDPSILLRSLFARVMP
jgi:CheY-like chemotaxis protein